MRQVLALFLVLAFLAENGNCAKNDTLEMELESNITVVKLEHGLKFAAHSEFGLPDNMTDLFNSTADDPEGSKNSSLPVNLDYVRARRSNKDDNSSSSEKSDNHHKKGHKSHHKKSDQKSDQEKDDPKKEGDNKEAKNDDKKTKGDDEKNAKNDDKKEGNNEKESEKNDEKKSENDDKNSRASTSTNTTALGSQHEGTTRVPGSPGPRRETMADSNNDNSTNVRDV
ncbi:hypothetical protein L3Y34_007069 [Caenorhabditis briggsae]|uniref:Uncharacterized protein n=1 Tax=Caenorhabditis briggsae TaxID=6238 RepID=A0AAE9CZL8_CAEBR|nr:hypothetical protein L3Y34_007069 [Caenorhabditis briggsae]